MTIKEKSGSSNNLSNLSAELAGELSKHLDNPTELAQVSEQEFIDTYLPIAAAYHSKQQFDTGYWVGMAGSVNNGLIVTDSSGEPMFTTPPLITMASVRVETGFAQMIQEEAIAGKSGQNLSQVSAKYLNADTIRLSAPDNSANVIGWHKIFANYGYKMLSVSEAGEGEIVQDDTPVTQEVIRDGEDEFL